MQWKVGVIIDSFKLGVQRGIEKAAQIGADGFQIYITEGEMAPENMGREERQAFKKLVRSKNLEISALCGDLFKGFLNRETNPEVIRRSKRFIDLAVDLEVRIVTTHIGLLPHDTNAAEWGIGIGAVTELARYAEQRGCVFASETGPEEPTLLKRFLDQIPCKGMGVNYDPANLIMGGPFDHIGGVHVLKDYIVHTHAKDGVCLLKGPTPYQNKYLEVPLGEGSVAFPHYLGALRDIGYKGYLTIEREVGADPVADITLALKFLRSLSI
jgi:sugar phosphate isomerase/epimerase